MLSQIKVVYLGQIIPLWVRNSVLRIRVTSILPDRQDYVLLNNNAEVIVAPRERMYSTKDGDEILLTFLYIECHKKSILSTQRYFHQEKQ